MSLWYRFLYRVGITPWESDTASLAPQLTRLLDEVEAGGTRPPGRALDLGCGTGRWSLELARRGWQTTGIDVVPKAIEQARNRAQENGEDVEYIVGSVSDLRASGVDSGVSLFLDVECFNHLDDATRLDMGREVGAVAESDANLVLLGWQRGRRGPLPPGVDEQDLANAFPEWRISHQEPYDAELPAPLRNASPRWYVLERSPEHRDNSGG